MSKLFTPFPLTSITLPNRIIIAPMCQYSAIDGLANDWHFQHWSSMLMSGAGLFIIEATAVNPEGRISPSDLGIWDEKTANALKEQLNKARVYSDMPVAIQLAHAGRKASMPVPWLPMPQETWEVVAPSVEAFQPAYPTPRSLTHADIKQIQFDFVQAAIRSQVIGIDLIELHAAHGYLIHQFLSPVSNKRTDEYGGTLTNRMRFLVEIIQSIQAVKGFHTPIGVRVSATDWVDGGFNIEEAIELAKVLESLSCCYLHVSSGGLAHHQKISTGPLYQVPLAKSIKLAVPTLPIIAVGLITKASDAEQILESNEADLIGIARGILFNPRWPWQAAVDLNAKVACPMPYKRSAPAERPDLFL